MKYCVQYKQGLKCLTEVDEIRIRLTTKHTIKDLANFLIEHKDQRCIIQVPKEYDENLAVSSEILTWLNLLTKDENVPNNFVLALIYSQESDEVLDKFYERLFNSGIPYLFLNPISDWDTLVGLAGLKPTDLYITNELGFDLQRVAEFLHKNNIQVRCIPNICQSQWKNTHSFKTFFIRPEDVVIYEPYVDVLELYDNVNQSIDKNVIDLYYQLYAIDKKWNDCLHMLIFNYRIEDTIHNDIINRYGFHAKRIKCRKKCLKGGKCNYCDAIFQFNKRHQEVLEKINSSKL